MCFLAKQGGHSHSYTGLLWLIETTGPYYNRLHAINLNLRTGARHIMFWPIFLHHKWFLPLLGFTVCLSSFTPGVGIGIVDLGYERRLASHLGAHRAPSIIGLVNGRVTFFHQAVVREYLRQFIEDLLPQKLVEKVNVNTLLLYVHVRKI